MADLSTTLYPHFVETLCQSMGADESLYRLFKFLREYIPADRICCSFVDRKNKTMHILVDYFAESANNIPWSKEIKKLFTWNHLYNSMDHKDEFIALQNNIEDDKELNEYIKSNFHVYYKSAMFMYLDINEECNSLFAVMFASNMKNQYNSHHIEAITTFRKLLTQQITKFFQSEENPYLIMTDESLTHATAEALLRRCKGMRNVMRKVDIVAAQSSTVLIQGASGTGKELVAETIHSLSLRRHAPLIKINCGAIPPTLLDSELFGYEKGAFTDARAPHSGYFEQAQGGTLYLDEIGELDLTAQVRLLRVLEAREIRRVGGKRCIPVDVRILAATNRDLRVMVEEGSFREDLWYRLNVYPIEIPPLKLRQEDIPVLTTYFCQMYAKEQKLSVPPVLTRQFMLDMAAHDWPGNVRQLRYVIERAFLESVAEGARELRLADQDRLPAHAMLTRTVPKRRYTKTSLWLKTDVEEALAHANGQIQGKHGAAALLGVSPSTLRSRMKALGLPLPHER